MNITGVLNQPAIERPAEAPVQKRSAKTTVNLAEIDSRSTEQNVIKKIEWVYWAGERHGLVTLVDGGTLFFDEFAWCVNQWQVGDCVQICKKSSGNYVLCRNSEGRLANYCLYPDRHQYIIRDW